MEKLVINGGKKLYGEVKIQGAKNAILPLFAAAILTDDKVVINNVPDLSDVDNMIKILKNLGVKVDRYGSTAVIDASNLCGYEIPNGLAKELRSSIFLLGSVLSRCKKAKVAYPGGCDIGLRPIDIHIKALRDLNVEVEESKGYIYCNAENFKSTEISLDYPSVGATENAILSSVLCKGNTVVHNAACEPEIVDLQNFLVKMGAKVTGAGTSVIKIYGVKTLHGTLYDAMPDRIAAGTYAIAVAMTGGTVLLDGARYQDMRALLSKLSKTSCNIICNGDKIYIKSNGKPVSVPKITTQPHPGFPTDLQAPMMALQTVSDGVSIFTENIFENRYRHVGELIKMGADIVTNGRTAVIKGVPYLTGTEVYAQDLRGGAALILAGLKAEGTTIVKDVRYVDRGYEKIEEVFRSLGAEVRRD